MLADALAQVPVLALSKRTTDVLLDANFECFANLLTANGNANVLLFCYNIGDAVHCMLGVLAFFAFGLFYHHVYIIAENGRWVNRFLEKSDFFWAIFPSKINNLAVLEK